MINDIMLLIVSNKMRMGAGPRAKLPDRAPPSFTTRMRTREIPLACEFEFVKLGVPIWGVVNRFQDDIAEVVS